MSTESVFTSRALFLERRETMIPLVPVIYVYYSEQRAKWISPDTATDGDNTASENLSENFIARILYPKLAQRRNNKEDQFSTCSNVTR